MACLRGALVVGLGLILLPMPARAGVMADDEALARTIVLFNRQIAILDESDGDCEALGNHYDGFLHENAAVLRALSEAAAKRSEAAAQVFGEKFMAEAHDAVEKLGTPANRKKLRKCMGHPKVRQAFTNIL